MSPVRPILVLAAALLGSAPVLAQAPPVPERQVALPAEAGLVVAHRARQGRAILVELVPDGETTARYTRMVTLQTLPDLGRVPETTVLARFTARYRAGCPRSTVAPLAFPGASDGARLDCPLHPATGRMETVFVRLLDLAQDRAMVQVTLTRVPMPDESRWARDYLARVAVR